MATPLSDDTRLTLRFEGEARPTTIGLFLADNPDDIDPVALHAALNRGEVYRGGGGASPEWSVELAS